MASSVRLPLPGDGARVEVSTRNPYSVSGFGCTNVSRGGRDAGPP